MGDDTPAGVVGVEPHAMAVAITTATKAARRARIQTPSIVRRTPAS
jgi:hypothetical protein